MCLIQLQAMKKDVNRERESKILQYKEMSRCGKTDRKSRGHIGAAFNEGLVCPFLFLLLYSLYFYYNFIHKCAFLIASILNSEVGRYF